MILFFNLLQGCGPWEAICRKEGKMAAEAAGLKLGVLSMSDSVNSE
jgi:hypothetical protein